MKQLVQVEIGTKVFLFDGGGSVFEHTVDANTVVETVGAIYVPLPPLLTVDAGVSKAAIQ